MYDLGSLNTSHYIDNLADILSQNNLIQNFQNENMGQYECLDQLRLFLFKCQSLNCSNCFHVIVCLVLMLFSYWMKCSCRDFLSARSVSANIVDCANFVWISIINKRSFTKNSNILILLFSRYFCFTLALCLSLFLQGNTTQISRRH